jgi:hypothetical protein
VPGESGDVKATVVQGTRRVPVAYPVSADWSGSPNVHIGRADGARGRHVASFDPATGRLTALRPGEFTLAVTVNGTTTEVRRSVVSLRDRAA